MKLSDKALRLISHNVLNTTKQNLPAANTTAFAATQAVRCNPPDGPSGTASQLNLQPARKSRKARVLAFRRRS
jgi:hypothetical protein